MVLSLVAAASDNNVIGINNTLPWRLPIDMKFFKNLTMGHTVIMGRKTYESMGKPLLGRENIVITRNKGFKAEGCLVFESIPAAVAYCKGKDEVFVIGGAEIYRQTLEIADKVYLTRVHSTFNGDAHFVDINRVEWQESSRTDHPADEKNPFACSFLEFERRKK